MIRSLTFILLLTSSIALAKKDPPTTDVSNPPPGSECMFTPGYTEALGPQTDGGFSTCVASPVCDITWSEGPINTNDTQPGCATYTQEIDCDNGLTYVCHHKECDGGQLEDEEVVSCGQPAPTWEPSDPIPEPEDWSDWWSWRMILNLPIISPFTISEP